MLILGLAHFEFAIIAVARNLVPGTMFCGFRAILSQFWVPGTMLLVPGTMLVDRTRWLRIIFFNDGFCKTPSLSLGYASNLLLQKAWELPLLAHLMLFVGLFSLSS